MEIVPDLNEDSATTAPTQKPADSGRRKVLVMGAWAVPAVAFAATAPQASASTTDAVLCTWTQGDGTATVYADRIEIVQPGKGMAIFFATEATVIYQSLDVAGNAPHLNLGFLTAGDRHYNWHFDNYPKPNVNDPQFLQLPTVPVISADGLSYRVKYPAGRVGVKFAQVAGFNIHIQNPGCLPTQWGV